MVNKEKTAFFHRKIKVVYAAQVISDKIIWMQIKVIISFFYNETMRITLGMAKSSLECSFYTYFCRAQMEWMLSETIIFK